MPNDTPNTFPDLLAVLVPAVLASKPDAPEVAALVQQAKAQFPDAAQAIDAVLASLQSASSPGTAAQPSSGSWSGVASHSGMLTAGALLTSLYAYSGEISAALARWNLTVTSIWALLAVVAGVGALGGFLNGYLNSSGLILPRMPVVNGKLTFFPGFLGNVVTGAIAAIVTVWLATPGQPGADPGGTSKNLLTPAVVIGAFLSGLGGANILTSQRDKSLLWGAVKAALIRPSDPARASAVGAARSALEAFTVATGQTIPGTNPAVPAVPAVPAAPTVSEPESRLLQLVDPQGLRDHFASLLRTAKPAILKRDGTGLTLGVLAAVQALPPRVRDAVKDLRLVDVAGAPFDLLKTSIPQPAGTDPVAFTGALAQAWTAARDVKTNLDQLSENWALRP